MILAAAGLLTGIGGVMLIVGGSEAALPGFAFVLVGAALAVLDYLMED